MKVFVKSTTTFCLEARKIYYLFFSRSMGDRQRLPLAVQRLFSMAGDLTLPALGLHADIIMVPMGYN